MKKVKKGKSKSKENATETENKCGRQESNPVPRLLLAKDFPPKFGQVS